MLKSVYLPLLALFISACGSSAPPCPPPAKGDIVYVTGQGWHAEIGIPVEELGGGLKYYRDVFKGARVIMFGYGKQTFVTAPPQTVSEYCLGPVPGPAVVHVVGLRVTPLQAYPPENTVTLALPPGGSAALSATVWKEIIKDFSGNPEIVARSSNPDGMFYAALSEYNLFHTCNRWTADILHAAGLPVSGDHVVFSGQVMGRVATAARKQCP